MEVSGTPFGICVLKKGYLCYRVLGLWDWHRLGVVSSFINCWGSIKVDNIIQYIWDEEAPGCCGAVALTLGLFGEGLLIVSPNMYLVLSVIFHHRLYIQLPTLLYTMVG